jgi:two-component SAPR family response regulator
MPVLGGKQLAERVRAVRPTLRILFMSGYAKAAIAAQGILPPGTPVLQKPFTPDQLGRWVRLILDTPAGATPESG